MLIISLVDTGTAQIPKSNLLKEMALILKNSDGIENMIKPGTVLSINDQIMIYKSVDMVNRIVYLTKKKKSIPLSIEAISSINVYSGTKAIELGTKGMLMGGLIGGSLGLLLGVAIVSEKGGEDLDMVVYAPGFALIGSVPFGLIGTVIGYNQKVYNTYELGSGKWEVANK